jgi:hypothetical protein
MTARTRTRTLREKPVAAFEPPVGGGPLAKGYEGAEGAAEGA